LQVQLCHSQSVVRLPAGARRLASSTREPNQAYVVGGSAWGVQFHPEFNAAATIEYIHQFRDSLLDQKRDPDLLIDACVDTPLSHSLLRRFARIVRGRP
ncbi:MAG: GMP synthase, partial [Anaerolineae bacterium]